MIRETIVTTVDLSGAVNTKHPVLIRNPKADAAAPEATPSE